VAQHEQLFWLLVGWMLGTGMTLLTVIVWQITG
jgi:hypothetical protein